MELFLFMDAMALSGPSRPPFPPPAQGLFPRINPVIRARFGRAPRDPGTRHLVKQSLFLLFHAAPTGSGSAGVGFRWRGLGRWGVGGGRRFAFGIGVPEGGKEH